MACSTASMPFDAPILRLLASVRGQRRFKGVKGHGQHVVGGLHAVWQPCCKLSEVNIPNLWNRNLRIGPLHHDAWTFYCLTYPFIPAVDGTAPCTAQLTRLLHQDGQNPAGVLLVAVRPPRPQPRQQPLEQLRGRRQGGVRGKFGGRQWAGADVRAAMGGLNRAQPECSWACKQPASISQVQSLSGRRPHP